MATVLGTGDEEEPERAMSWLFGLGRQLNERYILAAYFVDPAIFFWKAFLSLPSLSLRYRTERRRKAKARSGLIPALPHSLWRPRRRRRGRESWIFQVCVHIKS